MNKFKKNLFIILLSLSLIGCSSQVDPPFVSPVSPVGSTNTSGPTATPTVNLTPAPTITVPAPASGMGVVHGRLLHLDDRPFANTSLRLGAIVWTPGQEGDSGFVAADKFTSPQAVTDAWGNFVIEDVPPGDYGLAVDNPELSTATVYVLDETEQKIIVINVTPDSVTALEEIRLEFE
jgi:hypothetical protein